MTSILVLDDDVDYLELCKAELAPRRVYPASTIEDAYAHVRREPLDLALIDLFLDEGSPSRRIAHFAWGIDVVAALRGEYPDMLLVLVSGGTSWSFAEAAKNAGANATVPKQFFSPSKIVRLIEDGKLRELEEACLPRSPISLARNEREHLTRVYLDRDCNASQSARDLGISRSTFYSKLRNWRP